MADSANGQHDHDEAALAVAARHALHDEELIAAHAVGALEAAEAARAGALTERCAACRDLAADIATITSAHRATTTMAIAAPRDFRLSHEDAARLGRPAIERETPASTVEAPAHVGSIGRRPVLERLRAAFAGLGRPLGGTLVAAGLVGVMIGSFGVLGSPAAAPAVPMTSDSDAEQEPGGRGNEYAPGPTVGELGIDGAPRAADAMSAPDLRTLVVGGSIALIAIGGVLLVATFRRPRGSG